MQPELSQKSKEIISQVLAMTEESRARMDKYTEEERAELERQGREMIAQSKAKPV